MLKAFRSSIGRSRDATGGIEEDANDEEDGEGEKDETGTQRAAQA